MDTYRIDNIDHFYGTKHVLSIDDVTIHPGTITGLAGPNGSGKSTFLKLLAFMEEPTYGEILFNGRKGRPFSDRVRFMVTMLAQTPYLMRRTVYDNIAYGLKIRRDTKNLRSRVHESLEQVGLAPDNFARRRWSALSGGEAQRVALAARLALRPEVLLLDEPTASVDANSARLIKEASLRAREEWGATIVVTTHDWQWLYETCDTVLHILHGRLFRGGLGCAVYGPWRMGRKENLLHKELQDGQILYVPKPEEGSQVAVLDPEKLKITLPGKYPLLEWNVDKLEGFVHRMFLEKNGEKVQISVKVAELTVTVRIERLRVEKMKLFPGREVTIAYDPRDIEWF